MGFGINWLLLWMEVMFWLRDLSWLVYCSLESLLWLLLVVFLLGCWVWWG